MADKREVKRGRPLEYQEEYVQKVFDLQVRGKLPCQLFAALNTKKSTFYSWLEKYPDFKESYELGRAHCEAYYADTLQAMIEERNDKGVKACMNILYNNFGWGREGQNPGTVNNIQINGNMNLLSTKSNQELMYLIESNLKQIPNIETALIEADKVSNGSEE